MSFTTPTKENFSASVEQSKPTPKSPELSKKRIRSFLKKQKDDDLDLLEDGGVFCRCCSVQLRNVKSTSHILSHVITLKHRQYKELRLKKLRREMDDEINVDEAIVEDVVDEEVDMNIDEKEENEGKKCKKAIDDAQNLLDNVDEDDQAKLEYVKHYSIAGFRFHACILYNSAIHKI